MLVNLFEAIWMGWQTDKVWRHCFFYASNIPTTSEMWFRLTFIRKPMRNHVHIILQKDEHQRISSKNFKFITTARVTYYVAHMFIQRSFPVTLISTLPFTTIAWHKCILVNVFLIHSALFFIIKILHKDISSGRNRIIF